MKHELLAPAGNMDVFYAVINAGADAVYIGGPKFGARAYAKNFSEEEILEAIDYAHIHDVKVYMTVNTLIKDREMEECIKMMIPFYEAGLDGVIIQDIGVLRRFREAFPDMELHTSTQMSISDVNGAKLLKEAGAVRIVTSRELSLEEIRRIRKEADIEVECFIHGALCYCYSGQCLLSSMIGGRSGNRGRCAQPCRLPYEVYSATMKKIANACEILSLKDLCTIEFLPELLEAGIDSLKIEGRMKQASYAYTVVSIYRKYLNWYLANGKEGYKVTKEDYQKLLDAGNRNGFTEGYYYKHNDTSMITRHGSAHNNAAMDEQEICKKERLPVKGCVRFEKNEPMFFSVTYKDKSVEVYGEICQPAKKTGLDREQVEKQFNKTGASNYVFEELSISLQEGIFVPVSAMNQLRRNAFSKLTEVFSKKRVYDAYSYVTEECTRKDCLVRNISASVLSKEQLDVVLKKTYITRVYLETTEYLGERFKELICMAEKVKSEGKEVYLTLPFVVRNQVVTRLEKQFDVLMNEKNTLIDGVLVRSYDGVYIAKKYNLKSIADQGIYTFSNDAKRMSKELGLEETTIPYELKETEIIARNFEQSELVVYGRIPVIVSAGCVHKNTIGCDKNSQWTYLKDRKGFLFPVRNFCASCYNVIYNSLPTCLFQKDNNKVLCSASHRFAFTVEQPEQVEAVLALYERTILLHQNNAKELNNFTWGHFHRGVE